MTVKDAKTLTAAEKGMHQAVYDVVEESRNAFDIFHSYKSYKDYGARPRTTRYRIMRILLDGEGRLIGRGFTINDAPTLSEAYDWARHYAKRRGEYFYPGIHNYQSIQEYFMSVIE